MKQIIINSIEAEVSEGGYPIWVSLSIGGDTIRFNHTAILDLEFAIKSIKTEILMSNMIGSKERCSLIGK